MGKLVRAKSVVASAAIAVTLLAGSGCGSGSSSNSPQSQLAAVKFTATGSATENQGSCGDLPCDNGDTCACLSGSSQGSLVNRELNSDSTNYGTTATVNYQLSLDETATFTDRKGEECVTATGNVSIQLVVDTGSAGLTLDAAPPAFQLYMAGLDCDGRFDGAARFIGSNSGGIGSIEIKPAPNRPSLATGATSAEAQYSEMWAMDVTAMVEYHAGASGTEGSGGLLYGHGGAGEVSDLVGFGQATDTGASCANVACNAGDTCDCITGSVSGPNPNPDKRPHVTSIKYELSVDDTAALDDGDEDGKCMPATGNGVITVEYDGYADFPQYPIDFGITGLDCTVPGGMSPDGLFNGTIRIDSGSSADEVSGWGSMEIGDIGAGTTEVLMAVGPVSPAIDSQTSTTSPAP